MATLSQDTMRHLTSLLGFIQSNNSKAEDPQIISGTIKRAQHGQKSTHLSKSVLQNQCKKYSFSSVVGKEEFRMKNFEVQNQKLEWIGVNFGSEMAAKIQVAVRELGVAQKVEEIRFWGVIQGTRLDYYIAQGLKQVPKSHDNSPASAQKLGVGANLYSFWVCNNPIHPKWTLLPQITPEHISQAGKIKKLFTGVLDQKINSQPSFNGTEKHYLKAQLCRITHSLQLAPKGIYKQNDENPKIVEFEQEVKVPQTQEMNSLETWVHRNQMILGLGRCSHYVDPTLPEELIEQKMSELAEKDPEVERLRGITQDKVPESLGLGIENPWTLRFEGDTQVFTKDQASLVYGVVVLKNVFWPGWITLGYKNGFTNFYLGNGLKLSQASWDNFTNNDLQVDSPQTEEYPEPNPKQLPPVEAPVEGEGQAPVDE